MVHQNDEPRDVEATRRGKHGFAGLGITAGLVALLVLIIFGVWLLF